MSTDVAKWLYRIDANYTWTSPFKQDADYAFFDARGRLRLLIERNGAITVTHDYTWNGCSPKFHVLDLLFGTPEGVVNARTGQRKTYYASLVHDALYQFLADDLPLTRAQADRCFLALLRESAFLLAPLYWGFVRLFGGLVHFATRRWRDWDGSRMRLGDEIPAPPPAPSPQAVAGSTTGMSAALHATAARAPAAGAVHIAALDHFVLTVADMDATIAFYVRVLGMRHVVTGDRHALHFGDAKLNIHPEVNDYPPLKAAVPTLGSEDICLVADGTMEDVVADLRAAGVEIEVGPVARAGALGSMTSVYFRDPDANLVEISVYG